MARRVLSRQSVAPLTRGSLVGVIHLAPLPGSPLHIDGADSFLKSAARDAQRLVKAGFDALIVENFGDAPFLKEGVAPETIAAMALAVRAVQEAAPTLPVGVNVLRNDARAALGIAAATGAKFIRVNVHIGAAVTDQGLIEGKAAETLRARAALGEEAEKIWILADVHVKHAKPLAEVPLEIAIEETILRGRADAAIVTGATTGRAPQVEELARAREALAHIGSSPTLGGEPPLLILGSGLTAENAPTLAPLVDAAIVGTSVKERGVTTDPVDPARAEALVKAWRAARRG